MSNNSINTTMPIGVTSGGTGDSSLTLHGVLLGQGTGSITTVPVGTTGQVLMALTGADPAFNAIGTDSGLTAHSVILAQGLGAFTALGAATDGELIIGSTGSNPSLSHLTAGSGISITNGPGSITIASSISQGIVTLDGDSGAATGTTVTLAGGHNITTAAAGSTVTIQVTGTTNHAVQVGNSTGSLSSVTVGTNGQVLTGVTSGDPIFASLGTNSGLTAHSILLGQNNSAITALGVATNGQLPIGSTGADPVLSTLTAGTGINITNAAGSITIASTVSSGIVTISGNSGSITGTNVTIAGGNNITTSGSSTTLTVGVSGTTNHSLLVGNSTGSLSSLGVAINGQIPIGSTGADPVLTTLTAGSGINITNGAGSITIATTGGGVGISTLNGDTGSATGSTVTLAGGNNITTSATGSTVTLNVSGTTNHSLLLGNSTGSLTSLGAATNGQLPIGSTGVDPVLATLTAGSGISVTNGAGSITIANTHTQGAVTFNGDSGSATGTTINLSGGNNITTSATGSTVTFNVSGTTNHAVQVGNATNSLTSLAVGTTGQVLIGSTGANPAFGALGVNSGLTAHGVLLGEGNSAIVATTAGTTGQVLIGSTGADPAFGNLGVNSGLTAHSLLLGQGTSAITALGAATNGQIPIGSTGADPVLATLTSGASTNISITNGAGSITVDLVSSPSVSGSVTAGTKFISAAGTAAAPSVTFTGNTTSGMYSPAANQLGLSTNGVAALTIASTGALTAANLAASAASASGSVHADTSGNLTNFGNIYSSSHYTTTQSAANNTATAVKYDTDDNNVGSIGHPDISGGVWTQFAAPTGGAGFYIVSTSTTIGAFTLVGVISSYFLVNGVTTTQYGEVFYQQTSTGTATVVNNTALIFLNAGDYVQLIVRQTSGAAVNIGSAGSTIFNRFQMARLM